MGYDRQMKLWGACLLHMCNFWQALDYQKCARNQVIQ